MLTGCAQGLCVCKGCARRAGPEPGLALTTCLLPNPRPQLSHLSAIKLRADKGPGINNSYLQGGATRGHSASQPASQWPLWQPQTSGCEEVEAELLSTRRAPPPAPTSGMLFAYRRSWDLFVLAVFQPRPKLMLSR